MLNTEPSFSSNYWVFAKPAAVKHLACPVMDAPAAFPGLLDRVGHDESGKRLRPRGLRFAVPRAGVDREEHLYEV